LNDKNIELITTKGIYIIEEIGVDDPEALVSAVEENDVLRVQKLVFIAEARMRDLNLYLQSLIKPDTPPQTAFRLKILSPVFSLSNVEHFLSYKSLHIDLYNYLWASYFNISPSNFPWFAKLISILLGSILGFSIEKNDSCGTLESLKYTNYKPLFGRLDIEAGFNYIVPLLYEIKEPLPINQAILQIINLNFNKLKISVQLYLLVLAEQTGLELPVHKLIITCEKLEGCKILRVLTKLASVELLFSQYDPIFSQDTVISLLPLPWNPDLSIKTTRILNKTLTNTPKDISRLTSALDHFMKTFTTIFNGPEGFSNSFKLSLTRFLILFGYSLHKIKSEGLYKSYLKVLECFKNFYDMHQITLTATALRSYTILSAIYEFKQDWTNFLKARLLQNDSEPWEILQSCLEKVEEEHEAAEMIYSTLLYSLKLGYTKDYFISKSFHPKYEALIDYIVNKYLHN
jgi:hypothetical protein